MEYLAVSPEALNKAAAVLCSGGLVAFPTETVYGLGADAYNHEALAKVFDAKGRPRFDPLIVHITSVETLETAADLSLLGEETKRKLFLLAENLWPGPLSLILPKSEKIPGIATSGLPTAAFRFPSHEAARALISLAGGAVAAPSANPFGALSPTRAEHVRDKLGDKVDIILDGGPASVGVESTVLDITGEKMRILRPGGTPKEAIEALVGRIDLCPQSEDNAAAFASPGMLKSHYAPNTPLSVFENRRECTAKELPFQEGCAYLFFESEKCDAPFRVLSESGNLIEAAANLFEALHELEKSGYSHIFAEFAPQKGLGEAINDRLRRAAFEHS